MENVIDGQGRQEEIRAVDMKNLKGLARKLGEKFYDERLSQDEKKTLTHQFLLESKLGEDARDGQRIIRGDAWKNCHSLFESENVVVEDLPLLSKLVLKNGKDKGGRFWTALLSHRLRKIIVEKQDEIPPEVLNQVMGDAVEVMETSNLEGSYDFWEMSTKIDPKRIDLDKSTRIESCREEIENKYIEVLKNDEHLSGYLRFFQNEKLFPKLTQKVFERIQAEIPDSENLSYWVIDGLDKIYEYPQIEKLLMPAVEDHIGIAAILLDKMSKKDEPWKHESYIPDLVEKSKESVNKYLYSQFDAIEDFVTFKELFEGMLGAEDTRQTFEILDRMRVDDGDEVRAKIWLEALRSDRGDKFRLSLETMCSANNIKMDELPKLFDNQLSYELLEVLLRNQEKYPDQIALLLAVMDSSKLPQKLFQQIDAVVVDASLKVEPPYKGWYLCDDAEGLMFKNLKDNVMLVNDSMLVKMDGKPAAMCLKSFTLRGSGRTFLAGSWYCPEDNSLRTELAKRFRQGDRTTNIDEGVWMLMRSVKNMDDEEMSASELIGLAKKSAEKCRKNKNPKVGIAGRKKQVAHIEGMG